MTLFLFSKQKRETISHSLFLQFLSQEKPFLVSDAIAVGREMSKGEVYYYFGASHQMEGRNTRGIVSIAIWGVNIFDSIFNNFACLTAPGKNMPLSLLFLHFMV